MMHEMSTILLSQRVFLVTKFAKNSSLENHQLYGIYLHTIMVRVR